jgi:predicted ferric reductase
MDKTAATGPMSPGIRALLAALVMLAIVLLVGGALTIPYKFESSSMFYKFGMDKIILRSAKMAGLAAAVLLLLQLPLAGRLKWLDSIFSLPGLYRAHRFNAYVIGGLVLLHPILIKAAQHSWLIPLETRYWPEWIGAVLLALIVAHIGLGRWHRRLFRAYGKWCWTHGALAVAIYTGLVLHILNVSESFQHDSPPRTWLVAVTLALGLFWLWFQAGRLMCRGHAFRVSRVTASGRDAYTIDLAPERGRRMAHLPGQFARISFRSSHLSREFHPFTIASSPSSSAAIQFTIRCCGDWTREIGTLREDDRACIQGPFGRFSHLFLQPHREIIMIAGGIGITPMLSMLRYMSDNQDPRRVTLIWSNQTPAHLFGSHEMEAMEQKLTGFKWVPIFTREAPEDNHVGRLDQRALETLLGHCGRGAAVFLCGPPAMVMQIRTALKRIGFSRKSIYTEAFGF